MATASCQPTTGPVAPVASDGTVHVYTSYAHTLNRAVSSWDRQNSTRQPARRPWPARGKPCGPLGKGLAGLAPGRPRRRRGTRLATGTPKGSGRGRNRCGEWPRALSRTQSPGGPGRNGPERAATPRKWGAGTERRQTCGHTQGLGGRHGTAPNLRPHPGNGGPTRNGAKPAATPRDWGADTERRQTCGHTQGLGGRHGTAPKLRPHPGTGEGRKDAGSRRQATTGQKPAGTKGVPCRQGVGVRRRHGGTNLGRHKWILCGAAGARRFRPWWGSGAFCTGLIPTKGETAAPRGGGGGRGASAAFVAAAARGRHTPPRVFEMLSFGPGERPHMQATRGRNAGRRSTMRSVAPADAPRMGRGR
jgi:hypothetical protein